MLFTDVEIRRHSSVFGVGSLLPCLVSAILNVCAFLMPDTSHGIYILVANLLVQTIFIQDLITTLPLAISRLPSICTLSVTLSSSCRSLRSRSHDLQRRFSCPSLLDQNFTNECNRLFLPASSYSKAAIFTSSECTSQKRNANR